eukprot:CAMPEP_0202913206 /NCGR_PEP_ID=MMETSP1392-20130828/59880_1 /ASSEMBLY_ACC=CAM_ASM_000868 /TAXON_ID=225041 /ORGANISM="Chlamydomonas chlamydogama, Strain SAG 11-48b" /LENGTH=181 /DNA_ID=CAMNT_0049604387 /DNA_START=33 /DNA_END=575 /DNA_ORIENTATION=-
MAAAAASEMHQLPALSLTGPAGLGGTGEGMAGRRQNLVQDLAPPYVPGRGGLETRNMSGMLAPHGGMQLQGAADSVPASSLDPAVHYMQQQAQLQQVQHHAAAPVAAVGYGAAGPGIIAGPVSGHVPPSRLVVHQAGGPAPAQLPQVQQLPPVQRPAAAEPGSLRLSAGSSSTPAPWRALS